MIPDKYITGKIFYGLEAEGPAKGSLTLFVPCSIVLTADELERIARERHISRFYFGAGKDYGIQDEQVRHLDLFRKKFFCARFVVETEMLLRVPPWITQILVVQYELPFTNNVMVKLESDEMCHVFHSPVTTRPDDSFYHSDQEIER